MNDDQFEAIKKHIKILNSRLDILSVVEYYGIEYEESSSGRYKAICPFHNDNSPSLHLYTENEHGEDSWSCFVCNDNGDCFRFIRQMADSHQQAKQIAQMIGSRSGNRIVSERHRAIQRKLRVKKKIFLLQNNLGVRYREWLISLRGTDKYEKACERVDAILEEMDGLVHGEKFKEAKKFIKAKSASLKRYESQ